MAASREVRSVLGDGRSTYRCPPRGFTARFSSDQTAVRATMRADLLVPYPEAVVRIAGILP
ncbi:MAG: phage major capsid protein [Actinomycetota bacterium]|nr:phage major capsid protein [Actinomycetota bacterium]